MSCSYADGLSPYENKGVLGIAERFDTEVEVEEKVSKLVELLQSSNHVVVHTGAGISTSAGIPDFRGPKGVWTLEEKGEKPNLNISFSDALPTTTHMALRCLVSKGYVQYIVSQNIDGLHLKSGLPRRVLSELHGNIFVEQCNKCRRQFVRSIPSDTVGQKLCGGLCRRECRGGMLLDNVLDWEHDLPERDLDLALMHSTLADLNITLGTTLQIIPSGNLPLKNKKHGGKLVICNLQPTKHDKKADLVINTYVDDVLTKVCKRLGLEIPSYDPLEDPTKTQNSHNLEWTMQPQYVKEVEKQYNAKLKLASAKRKADKTQFTFSTKQEATGAIKKPRTKIKNELKTDISSTVLICDSIKKEDVLEVIGKESPTCDGIRPQKPNGEQVSLQKLLSITLDDCNDTASLVPDTEVTPTKNEEELVSLPESSRKRKRCMENGSLALEKAQNKKK